MCCVSCLVDQLSTERSQELPVDAIVSAEGHKQAHTGRE